MDRLRSLPNVAKVLLLIGAVMFVSGLIRMLAPYSVSSKTDSYTQSCGSVVAPKDTVSTINCNRGGRAAFDLAFIAGGLIVVAGGATLWRAESSF